MPDSVVSRSSAAARHAADGPPRRNAGGQPLKTKAEKRAEAKAAKARARAMRRRRRALAVGGAVVLVLALVIGLITWIGNPSSPPAPAAASAAPSSGLGAKPTVTGGTGAVTALKTTPLIEGTGAAVQSGQTIKVNYVGVTYADGKEFDSSWGRSEPFSFQVGAGKVIQGWDQGLLGVKVGSRVQLDIPADMAYGENPGGGQPAGALRFVVDVLSAS